jgi:hypothetical protein
VYQNDTVVRRIIVGAIRQMFEPGLPADSLYALHVDTHPDAGWERDFRLCKGPICWYYVSGQMKESLYAAAQYDGWHSPYRAFLAEKMYRT